jgi:hypothetical protein
VRNGVKEVMEGFHRRMEALIASAQEAGEIRADISPAKLGHNLWALYFHFLLRWLGSGRSDPAALLPNLREMLELQLVGLRPAKPAGGRPSRETRS